MRSGIPRAAADLVIHFFHRFFVSSSFVSELWLLAGLALGVCAKHKENVAVCSLAGWYPQNKIKQIPRIVFFL